MPFFEGLDWAALYRKETAAPLCPFGALPSASVGMRRRSGSAEELEKLEAALAIVQISHRTFFHGAPLLFSLHVPDMAAVTALLADLRLEELRRAWDAAGQGQRQLRELRGMLLPERLSETHQQRAQRLLVNDAHLQRARVVRRRA